MPTNDLDTRFWRACDILRHDDNTQSLLDYVEQISWLLFLKSFEDLEDTRVADAEYEGRPFARVIDGFYRWSVWTGGRVNRAQASQREAEAALRSAQKALLGLETMLVPDPDALNAARRAFREAETAVIWPRHRSRPSARPSATRWRHCWQTTPTKRRLRRTAKPLRPSWPG